MDEILKKLLESELLSEESKADITEQFQSATESLREELALEVRAELVEQWTEQRDTLIQSVDEKVTEMLSDEMDELKEDIARFRDLEVEYAEKLVNEKHKLAEQLGGEIDELVDKLDSFLEYRLTEEMNELKEDLDLVRQNQFGRKIFEAFMTEFNGSFVDEKSVQAKLSVAEAKLSDAESKLYEMEQEKKVAERSKTMESVLAPLTGVKREQMGMILANVETHKLQEAYNMFVGRVLKEEAAKPEVAKVIEEEAKTISKPKPATKVVTGDDVVVEEVEKTDLTATNLLKETLRLAGVTQ
jgi:hypothetical protein